MAATSSSPPIGEPPTGAGRVNIPPVPFVIVYTNWSLPGEVLHRPAAGHYAGILVADQQVVLNEEYAIVGCSRAMMADQAKAGLRVTDAS